MFTEQEVYIAQLLEQTYRSASTLQIKQAEYQLMESFNFTEPSKTAKMYDTLEKMLMKSRNNHLNLSIVNLIKQQTFNLSYLIRSNNRDCLFPGEAYRAIVFKIEHMVDNEHIQLCYKRSICIAYNQLNSIITPDMYEKYISKINYYYNVKNHMLALLLTKTFMDANNKIQVNNYLYNQSVFKMLEEFIKILHQSQPLFNPITNQAFNAQYEGLNGQHEGLNGQQSSKSMSFQILDEFIIVLHQLIMGIGFQKYETFVKNLLIHPQFKDILVFLYFNAWNEKVMVMLLEIIEKIVRSLGKNRRYSEFNELVNTLSSIVHAEWNSFVKKESNDVVTRYEVQKNGEERTCNWAELPAQINKQVLNGKLKVFIASVQYNLLALTSVESSNNEKLSYGEIFNIFVYKIYLHHTQLFAEYIQHQDHHSLHDLFLILEETSFQMKVQRHQTLLNKLLFVIVNKNQQIGILLKQMIFSFFFHHFHSCRDNQRQIYQQKYQDRSNLEWSKEQNSNGYQEKDYRFAIRYELARQMWQGLPLDLQTKLKSMLLIVALQVKYFMKDISFLNDLEVFILRQYKILLMKEPIIHRHSNLHHTQPNNIDIIFYFFVAYQNYQDDILQELEAEHLTDIILQIALMDAEGAVISLARKIIENSLQMEYPYEVQKHKIEKILTFIENQKYSSNLHQLLLAILKHNSKHIEDKRILEVIEQVFKEFTAYLQLNQPTTKDYILTISNYFELFSQFFNNGNWVHIFEYILNRCKQIIIQYDINLKEFSSEFFTILSNAISHLKQIPEGYEELIYNIRLYLTNTECFNCINLIVIYSKQKDHAFVEFIMSNILNGLESVTQFKREGQNLNDEENKSVNGQFDIDFLQKIKNSKNRIIEEQAIKPECLVSQNLIYPVLLLHNMIYYHHEQIPENYLQRIINKLYAILNVKIHEFNQINGKINVVFLLLLRYEFKRTTFLLQHLNILDEVYKMLYVHENVYRLEYDLPIFINLQLWMLDHCIAEDQNQLKYANVSFVAVFWNLERLFQSITCEQHQISSTESDQSLDIETQMSKEYKIIKSILAKFIKPPLFENMDLFSSFRNFVDKLNQRSSSKEWLTEIKDKGLSKKNRQNFAKMINLQKIEGKYRKINRVKNI